MPSGGRLFECRKVWKNYPSFHWKTSLKHHNFDRINHMITFFYFTAIVLFMLLCMILCFVILIQESKSTGLGASFGGDSGDSLFGTSTADILKKFTAWLAIVFLGACVLLSVWTSSLGRAEKQNPAPFTMERVES